LRTSQSNVPIVGPRSLSVLGNKSSTRLKALPMSLSVVLNAAEPTKHSVPKVTVTATHHGINPSAYLSPVSHTRWSFIGKAGNMRFYLVLSALQGYYWDTVRGILPILSMGGRK